MRFLFSTGSLRNHGHDAVAALAAGAGFDGLEVVVDARRESRQADDLARLTQRHGLPVGALHAPFDSVALPDWPTDPLSRLAATVKLAEAVGAPVVVHHLPPRRWFRPSSRPGAAFPAPPPGEDAYRNWMLDGYRTIQAGTAVRLCIENLPAFRVLGRRINPALWNTPAEIARFPCLTMDTTHLGTWGIDPVSYYEQLAGQIGHVHLSNFDGRRQHRRPEEGLLPLDRLLARMQAGGYSGAVTLELRPDALEADASDATVAGHMAASLAFCRQSAAA
jgi:sugar phosphate isomerase/epimerase